jgi:hypothetical protein
MKEHEIRQADLVGIIGSRGVVSEVVTGKRAISKAQAKALGKLVIRSFAGVVYLDYIIQIKTACLESLTAATMGKNSWYVDIALVWTRFLPNCPYPPI